MNINNNVFYYVLKIMQLMIIHINVIMNVYIIYLHNMIIQKKKILIMLFVLIVVKIIIKYYNMNNSVLNNVQ